LVRRILSSFYISATVFEVADIVIRIGLAKSLGGDVSYVGDPQRWRSS